MVAVADLKWCKRQAKGIRLIEPNDNLSQEYIATSEETLEVLRCIENKSKVWLAAAKYYCEYFAVYSFLMKLGIKCEIHECTIALCRLLEEKGLLPGGYSKILEEDKQLRIDNQYYLKNREVRIDYDKIADFVLKIKHINSRLTSEKIKTARELIAGL